MRCVALCASLLILASGCLNSPDDTFPIVNNQVESDADVTADAGADQNNTTGDDAGGNNETSGGCDGCALGETRCAGDTFEECVSDGDEGSDCTTWAVTQTCTGAQSCVQDDGCVCDTTCELGGEVECLPNGAFVCLMVDARSRFRSTAVRTASHRTARRCVATRIPRTPTARHATTVARVKSSVTGPTSTDAPRRDRRGH